jgi:thioredoxin reductase (NADPH)
LTGRGVYYGAAGSEADALVGEDVFIVGGANSAGQAALHFSKSARSVTMLIRGATLAASMSQYLVKRIEETDNINLCFDTQVARVLGQDRLEALELCNTRTGKSEVVPAATLFVFVGATPRTEWLESAVARDSYGFILTGRDLLSDARHPSAWTLDREPLPLETSAAGVFAAGDVRHGSAKRVAAAVGEGSMSVMLIWDYRASLGL